MFGPEMTRRELLGLLTGCVIVGLSRYGIAADADAGKLKDVLIRMARYLFPHDVLADRVYTEILAPLESTLANNSLLAESMDAGHESLNAAAGGDWLGANTELQIAAVRSLENSEFFRAVREAVRTELYYHPAVWELIGFEGSSVEYGGYIDRGFDKIDWLPED